MQICKQGNGHYLNGINNQDFCYAEKNLKLLTDGCSEGKFSEVGTRLFCQAFAGLEDRFDVTKFDKNVKNIFSRLMEFYGKINKGGLTDFIVNNLLFTIVACFELDDKFVVKYLGDGYVITVNSNDMISYMRLSYGKTPPYYAYNTLSTEGYNKKLEFKTFEFSKKDFKKVGIASDGIAPIIDKRIADDFEGFILEKESVYTPEGIIKSNSNMFFDDVTILI